MIKKLLTSLAITAALVVTVNAQQYRTTVKTNATVSALEGNIVATNLTVFTAGTGKTWHRLRIQNESAWKVRYMFGAITTSTNGTGVTGTSVTNALAAGPLLNAAGSVGDTAIYEDSLPAVVTISAQGATLGGTNTASVLNIEALGN